MVSNFQELNAVVSEYVKEFNLEVLQEKVFKYLLGNPKRVTHKLFVDYSNELVVTNYIGGAFPTMFAGVLTLETYTFEKITEGDIIIIEDTENIRVFLVIELFLISLGKYTNEFVCVVSDLGEYNEES